MSGFWLLLLPLGAFLWHHWWQESKMYKAADKCPECQGLGYNLDFEGKQAPCHRCDGYAVWVERFWIERFL